MGANDAFSRFAFPSLMDARLTWTWRRMDTNRVLIYFDHYLALFGINRIFDILFQGQFGDQFAFQNDVGVGGFFLWPKGIGKRAS